MNMQGTVSCRLTYFLRGNAHIHLIHMPDFGNPFAGNIPDRKLTKEELVRAVRFSISAEYEAIQLYTQLADSTTDKLTQAVMRDIAKEEVVHVGEFLRLLHTLAPEEAGLYEKGYTEVEELMEKTKAK